jgi:hypothetical protein
VQHTEGILREFVLRYDAMRLVELYLQDLVRFDEPHEFERLPGVELDRIELFVGADSLLVPYLEAASDFIGRHGTITIDNLVVRDTLAALPIVLA